MNKRIADQSASHLIEVVTLQKLSQVNLVHQGDNYIKHINKLEFELQRLREKLARQNLDNDKLNKSKKRWLAEIDTHQAKVDGMRHELDAKNEAVESLRA